MHVVHVIWHLGIGGGELFLRDLAIELRRRQIAQQVWTVGPAGVVARDLTAEGIEVRSYHKATKTGLRTIARMARELRRSRPGLVHLHGEGGLVWGTPAANLAGVPAISLMYVNHEETRLKMRVYRHLLRRTVRVVAGSASVRTFLEARLAVPSSRLEIIPCGIVPERFAGPTRVSERARVVVTVGRLVRHKGHHVLLDAFRDVIGRRPDAELRVVGDGPERAALERQSASLGLGTCVRFLGTCYPTGPALADADAFVFPSLEEPQGLALLEAAACGVPIVASRTGGIPEMIAHEVSGLLTNPGDPGDLAAALVRMLEDADLRHRCATAARRQLSAFDIHAIGDRYVRLYRSVARGPVEVWS